MRIGIFAGDTAGRTIDDVVAEARATADDGFAGYWIPQIFGMDALTVLAVVGREVPRIELGTAVVPTYPRHPMTLAQQALTVQAISGDRLALGIGLSHQMVIENMFGPFVREAGAAHARVPRGPDAVVRTGKRVVRRRDAARGRRRRTCPAPSP